MMQPQPPVPPSASMGTDSEDPVSVFGSEAEEAIEKRELNESIDVGDDAGG